jgi:uncharacterized protein (TIGR02145 family)
MKINNTIWMLTIFSLTTGLTLSQSYSEDFEDGDVVGWEQYRANEEMIQAIDMASAPAVLTGGGTKVGYIQDVDATYSGAAILLMGDRLDANYTVEADVYVYENASPSAYTGIVAYGDSSEGYYVTLVADFDANNRFRLRNNRINTTTFEYTFHAELPTDGIDKSEGWHHMKMQVTTDANTNNVSYQCWYDNVDLGTYIDDTANHTTSGLAGVYAFQQDTDGLAGYFDNVVVEPIAEQSRQIAYYPFNGNANDESGNGRDGELMGGATSNSTLIIGSNDVDAMSIPGSIVNGLEDLSVTAIVKLDQNNPSHHLISVANSDQSNVLTIQYHEADNNWNVVLNGVYHSFDMDDRMEDMQFHHLALSRAGNIFRLYLDSEEIGDGIITANSPIVADTDGVIIGQDQDFVGGGFNSLQAWAGQIDNMRLFNYSLSLANVDSIYHLDGWDADTTYISGGAISTDSTWSVAGSPFVISGDITVNNGATLRIEPGVEVFLGNSNLLYISEPSRLIAIGEKSDSIRFYGDNNFQNNVGTSGIHLEGNSIDSLLYCTFYDLDIVDLSSSSHGNAIFENSTFNCPFWTGRTDTLKYITFNKRVVLYHGSITGFKFCNLNAGIEFNGGHGDTRPTPCRYNYWGPVATEEMNARGNPKNISTIDDGFDYPEFPFIDYSFWLDAPWPEGKPVLHNEPNTVLDIDRNIYRTVQIGDQVWMAENLKVTHYRNGDLIPARTSPSTWSSISEGAFCNYNNDDQQYNNSTYGLLYNWYAINDARQIAPEGWHVATEEDWQDLESFLGMTQNEVEGEERWRGSNEGFRLKSITGWESGGNGTDEVGFTGLPGGVREQDGLYSALGFYAHLWSSSESSEGTAWHREFHYQEPRIWRDDYSKNRGMSVRCVRDPAHKIEPIVLSIADVNDPPDQGGWVNISFSACKDDTSTKTGGMYSIERLDPEGWRAVQSLPAYGQSYYLTEARTLIDSSDITNGMTTFRVVASIADTILFSSPVNGYSVDNIAPASPGSLLASVGANWEVSVDWSPAVDEDFDYFKVYRSNSTDFELSDDLLVMETIDNFLTETISEVGEFYYRVSAIDANGNESEGSETASVLIVSVDTQMIPEDFALQQNYPNPFNPMTNIRFGIPEASDVSLFIYDIAGREIKTLINNSQPAGWYTAQWNGTTQDGTPVGTGMYFARIQAGEYSEVIKMVYLR